MHENSCVAVRLSERNLLTLLSKLYERDSSRCIFRDTTAGRVLIRAEADEQHYSGEPPPGLIHPRTQRVLSIVKEALA